MYGFAAPAVMNPGAYGSPQALFAAAPTAMGPTSFMDAFGNIHTTASPAVADPYGAALFGAPAAAPAAYMYAASSPAAPAMSGLGPGDEIRTVFVSGFPNDVKERELHNLLRFMPGYEASQMNWKTGGPQGFALFSSAGHARAVVDLLGGLQFDDGVVIRAEMAHKNMFIKVREQQAALGAAALLRMHACARAPCKVAAACGGRKVAAARQQQCACCMSA